jgi:putative ABC transport system permease protein
MKALRLALLALLRDGKSGELRVLGLALLVAVTALTAVGFFTSRVNRVVEQQAGEILAADLRLRSQRPVNPEYLELARQQEVDTAQLATFPTVVWYGDRSGLAAIYAVSERYPLRGKVRIAEVPYGPPVATDELPGSGQVWADARLMSQLGVSIGERLRVGTQQLIITKVLEYRPDQGAAFIDLAPTVLLPLADLPATGLVQPGSRVSYVGLFAGDAGKIERLKQQLLERKQGGEQIVELKDASPQIRTAVDRAGRFLNLAALATILLAAVAVAIAAKRYVVRHLDTAALMKSMGASQALVLQISLLELLMIGLSAGILGSVAGYLAQAGIVLLLQQLMPGELPAASLDVAGLGVVTAVLMLVGFALPPLLQLRHVPPARVLRRNLEPPPLRYTTVYGTALLALLGLLAWLLRDARLLGYVVTSTLVTGVVLLGAGSLLVVSLAGFRGSVGVSWRYGMANIARRGRESVIQIVAFGLGLMVLLLLVVVRQDLMEQWRSSLPPDAPNHFMINVRPQQTEAVQQFFAANALPVPKLVPMVRTRLTHINDVEVAKAPIPTQRGRSYVGREVDLSWAGEVQRDNKIVAGQWWRPGDEGGARISVEQDLAQDLGLKLGDRLTYNVGGETVTVKVANFRTVRWDTFRPNFFMVVSPGVLETALGTYVAALQIPAERRTLLADFARQFPEITVYDVGAILEQVRGVMDKATMTVQYVFGFTLLAGITVLLAAIQATRDERRYESAMLRTLGASRNTVLRGVAAEFATLGLLSGTLAAIGATVAGYFIANRLFDIEYSVDPMVWLFGLLAGALLVGVSGTLATRSVVNHPPATTLRNG